MRVVSNGLFQLITFLMVQLICSDSITYYCPLEIDFMFVYEIESKIKQLWHKFNIFN